jgi:ER membrane protein complex subunit 7, beta-sandwich domain
MVELRKCGYSLAHSVIVVVVVRRRPSSSVVMILHHVILLSLLSFVLGIDISGSINSSPALLSPSILPPTTRIYLTAPGVEYFIHPSSTGKFTFRNVTVGPSYLFHVECLTHIFPSLRLDTATDRVEVYQTFKGNEWSHRGLLLDYPIQVSPTAQADYYVVISYTVEAYTAAL